jgi:hypothetical protein
MPALDFPSNPIDGQIYEGYVYSADRNAWNLITVAVNTRFFVGSTAPTSPMNGDAWFDTTEGTTYVYYSDEDSSQWVETGNPVLSYTSVEFLSDVSLSTLEEV